MGCGQLPKARSSGRRCISDQRKIQWQDIVDRCISDQLHRSSITHRWNGDSLHTAPAGGGVMSSHSTSGNEILTDLDERTVSVVTGEGVAKARIIGEGAIDTNCEKDTLFPTPT